MDQVNFVYVLLSIIAVILWKIYRQKEDEKQAIADEQLFVEREAKQKEEFKNYPHLYGKLKGGWLQVFALQAKKPGHLLKMMFFLMLHESVRIDFSEGGMKLDSLWDSTKELLEHLETFHEGSITEHEIALCTYWQIAVTRSTELREAQPNTGSLSADSHTAPIEGEEFEKAPFTDIEHIASLFPKKANHPAHEITFFNKDGSFPRESKGSVRVDEKISALGL